jgi:hypothetical protein
MCARIGPRTGEPGRASARLAAERNRDLADLDAAELGLRLLIA